MELSRINVLASDSHWPWPQAVRSVFEPCGISMMLAKGPDEAMDIIAHHRIHTAILDMDSEKLNGLGIIRIIRKRFPALPCILLSGLSEQKLLSDALQLEVFSVISKPVDMGLLRGQLNRLFVKKYNSEVFAV